MIKKHVHVIAPDAINQKKLENLASQAGDLEIHPVGKPERIAYAKEFSFRNLLEELETELSESESPVDALIGIWDFPSSLLVPLLARRLNLNWASPEAVMRCEHKYWSRCLQKEVVGRQVPNFQALDPFVDAPQMDLSFPAWLKPIKGHSSQLGFRVKNEKELFRHLTEVRRGIARLGDPFNEAMAQVEIPYDISKVNGHHCIVEEIIGGRQCTLEGYVFQGQPVVYGIVDSRRYPNRSTFQRYQYPSSLPAGVKDRMRHSASKIMKRLGYDGATFNIEYYYDAKQDKIWLLEINPRNSQSHADLFEKVDGCSNQRIQIDLALGRPPNWSPRMGRFRCAAKFFHRSFEDARVVLTPSSKTLERLRERFPDTHIDIMVRPGQKLSDSTDQDSYSFELSRVYLGGDSTRDLLAKYEACVAELNEEYRLEEIA